MLNINMYLQDLTAALKSTFGTRLLYVGLQGSYLRGEATDASDIDVMLVLDELSLNDLDRYREILYTLGHYDRSCGFVCSREDLAHWNALEICHLLHTTKDFYGKLTDYAPSYGLEDVRQFTKLSLNNLYHELCHRYVHRGPERSLQALSGTYKGVFFILQSLHYLRSGKYIPTKQELLHRLDGIGRNVLQTAMTLREGTVEALEQLFAWCHQSMIGL